MHSLYAIAKDFAGPVATVLASATAVGVTIYFNRAQTRTAATQAHTAATQADIASEKLKLDLFDRRYAILTAAKQLVDYVVIQHQLEKADPAKVRQFYVTIDEARFLLPEGVRKFLDALHQASEDFFGVLGVTVTVHLFNPTVWFASPQARPQLARGQPLDTG